MPMESKIIARPGKSDLIWMTCIERTEILTELTFEIIDLKFTRTKNNRYRTELDPNIFCLNFLFKKSLLDQKSIYPKFTRTKTGPTKTGPEPNDVDPKWPNPKLTRSEPNRMTRLSYLIIA